MAESGVRVADGEVIHHAFVRGIEKRGLPSSLECQRLLFGIFYRARALSAADILGRYFTALRELGVYTRALIILTSDHGESLRDERGADGELAWGHNRVLANNLHVPLWVKFPTPTRGGEHDAASGLIGIRELVEAWLTDPSRRPTLAAARRDSVREQQRGQRCGAARRDDLRRGRDRTRRSARLLGREVDDPRRQLHDRHPECPGSLRASGRLRRRHRSGGERRWG